LLWEELAADLRVINADIPDAAFSSFELLTVVLSAFISANQRQSVWVFLCSRCRLARHSDQPCGFQIVGRALQVSK
jgi:hypothetical protein